MCVCVCVCVCVVNQTVWVLCNRQNVMRVKIRHREMRWEEQMGKERKERVQCEEFLESVRDDTCIRNTLISSQSLCVCVFQRSSRGRWIDWNPKSKNTRRNLQRPALWRLKHTHWRSTGSQINGWQTDQVRFETSSITAWTWCWPLLTPEH